MKPMLATAVELSQIQYPVYVSPKLDGIRAIIDKDGRTKSRTLKDIPNQFVQEELRRHGWPGMDGELIVGDVTDPQVFSKTMSGIMSATGEPKFKYIVFDLWDLTDGFEDRLKVLKEYQTSSHNPITILPQFEVNSEEGLLLIEEQHLRQGFEGTMIRNPTGPYKFGRSTVRQGYLLKRKPLADAEGIVIGFEYLQVNEAPAELNDVGYTQRSSAQEFQVTDHTRLGALKVRVVSGEYEGVEVSIGTGFTQEERQQLAQSGLAMLGEIVTFKYQSEGAKDKPRFPSFKGFRDAKDMS